MNKEKAPLDQNPKNVEKPKDSSAPKDETGGPKGPEPTRYGDWEINGKCVDF